MQKTEENSKSSRIKNSKQRPAGFMAYEDIEIGNQYFQIPVVVVKSNSDSKQPRKGKKTKAPSLFFAMDLMRIFVSELMLKIKREV